MEPEPLAGLKHRAYRAYERGRARHAAWAAAPTVAVVVVAALMSDRPLTTALIGAALYAVAALLSWRGRHLERGVLPGVAAGLVPFAMAHAARLYGHLCTPEGCVSICVPACLAGGFAAGALLSRALRRADRLGASWASACGVAALTGALGCACVGFGGVLALAAGLLTGTAPLALRPARGGA
ncbi:hypothetical protein SOCE26_010110 [Sorangium cellulosum]|uniref:Uncharacterized protein n=1 Tax=Sorangium cellulosum TaxID=56 RepID=A0A2L0EJY5_SORCE|nr:hypothetical protein [Sorangium cellulosum]AUX39617.1 hypothetical protein SOCE26_010110 [Sorangium cellulosum]